MSEVWVGQEPRQFSFLIVLGIFLHFFAFTFQVVFDGCFYLMFKFVFICNLYQLWKFLWNLVIFLLVLIKLDFLGKILFFVLFKFLKRFQIFVLVKFISLNSANLVLQDQIVVGVSFDVRFVCTAFSEVFLVISNLIPIECFISDRKCNCQCPCVYLVLFVSYPEAYQIFSKPDFSKLCQCIVACEHSILALVE